MTDLALSPVTVGTASRSLASRSYVLNVKDDFGAVGDGVTDDSAAFQRAINAAFGPPNPSLGGYGANGSGGVIFPNVTQQSYLYRLLYIPAGDYALKHTLVLTHVTGGTIMGAGAACTRLIYTGTIPGDDTTNGINAYLTSMFFCWGVFGCSFIGLTVDMQQNPPAAFGGDVTKFTAGFDLRNQEGPPILWPTVNPSAGQTITLDGTVVTFVASGASGNQINVGSSILASMNNAAAMLNASSDSNIRRATYAVVGVFIDNSNHANDYGALQVYPKPVIPLPPYHLTSTVPTGGTASGHPFTTYDGSLYPVPPFWDTTLPPFSCEACVWDDVICRNATYGLTWGYFSNNFVSEMAVYNSSFENCFLGIKGQEQNSLGNNVFGSHFENCTMGLSFGIIGATADCPMIMACTFKDNKLDIGIQDDPATIIGCRSTTSVTTRDVLAGGSLPAPSFYMGAGYNTYIAGCSWQSTLAVTDTTVNFFQGVGGVIDSCQFNGRVRISGSATGADPVWMWLRACGTPTVLQEGTIGYSNI